LVPVPTETHFGAGRNQKYFGHAPGQNKILIPVLAGPGPLCPSLVTTDNSIKPSSLITVAKDENYISNRNNEMKCVYISPQLTKVSIVSIGYYPNHCFSFHSWTAKKS
jgi:hypothetical protein